MTGRLRTRSFSVDLDDVYAICKGYAPNGERSLPRFHPYGLSYDQPHAQAPALYTRLRESGRNDPLLSFPLSGRDAMEVWEFAESLARIGGEFVRCGHWVLRPGRVRLIRYVETSPHCRTPDADYTVYIGMTDDRAGGWVAKIQLDLESGRALESVLDRSAVTAGT